MLPTTLIQVWRPGAMDHMGWGGWTLMLLFWLIVIGLVAWLVVTLVRRDGGDRARPREGRAESILRERYARGELDEETYRRMVDELRRP